MSLPDGVRAQIQNIVDSHKVVVFMKGTADQPQCGFSARTVEALHTLGVDFQAINVLQDPALRQGIKEFSQWPTIPQVYVDKEFIGGSDIVTQMAANGELHQALGIPFEPPKPPTVHFTDAFMAAIQGALNDIPASEAVFPRIQISPRFQYDIGFSQKSPGDLEVTVGALTVLIDPSSARRADGLKVDFHTGEGGGVLIDNPNEPASVRRMMPNTLKGLMGEGRELHLFDVRTPGEWETARIEGAVLLDAAGQGKLKALPDDALIVVMCHHGIRSMQAARQLVEAGYRNVYNLEGGIDQWSMTVDAAVPRY